MAHPSEGKLSRRTFLGAGTAVALSGGATLIFGCGDGGGRPTQTPKPSGVGAPRRGGDLEIGRHNAVFTIDPHIDATAPDIAELIYSLLYTWDAVNQIAIFNDLALAVEVPEPQLQEFIFSLRPGVKVHSHLNNPASGEELTSEDCKQSFVRRGTAITAPDKRLALAIGGTKCCGFDGARRRAANTRPAYVLVQASAA